MIITKGKTSRIFYQLSLMMVIASCNLINPDEKIPCYIKVDSADVSVTLGQGSAKQKIKDVWAYMDGQLIGVYEIPALFPVVGNEGKHSFLFAPGIYDNGIASTHIIYRLMKGPEMDISLINGATVSPPSEIAFTYFPGVTFSWLEDFEGSGLSIDSVPGKQMIHAENTEVFEGAESGKVTINTAQNSFRFQMFESVTLPIGTDSYLEMHYKCDYPFFVGLIGEKSTGNIETNVIYINPSDTWNKIYVNLGTAVRALSPSNGYKLFFASALADGATSGNFYFDNLKLIHN